jgi:hypothetical protein
VLAPELVDLGVTSVWRRQVRDGAMDARRAALALADLTALPLRRAPHRALLPQIEDWLALGPGGSGGGEPGLGRGLEEPSHGSVVGFPRLHRSDHH